MTMRYQRVFPDPFKNKPWGKVFSTNKYITKIKNKILYAK